MKFSFRRYLIVLLIFGTGILSTYAQIKYSSFDHLTTNNGLSSNRIRCIYRDSKDYLWMGVEAGLDKYDSYQVKKYRHIDNLSGSISSDILTCIYEDREKNMWFGTYDGLNLYDSSKDNFKVFKKNPSDNNSLNSNTITSIVEDKSGNLWVVTDGCCLNRWNRDNQSFIRYPFEKQMHRLSVRPSRMAAVDSKGNIWLGSLTQGIIMFDPTTGQFTKFDDNSVKSDNYTYKSIYIDKQDKLWITSDGNGFFSFDPATNKFFHYGFQGDGKGTNLDLILDIIPEDDRFLLLAVDQGGINRFDKITGRFEYILYDSEDEKGLNNNGIWCFCRDREGILWIGTSGGGINYFNPKKGRFKLFTHNSNSTKSLSYNFVNNIFEDHEGMIWIGTDGGGLNVYDPKKGSFKRFKHQPSDPYSISGNVVRGIAEDKDHNMWIGTWEAGLNMYDRKTGRFIRYMPDDKNPSAISGKTIWNIIIDHSNTLWVSIYNIGLDLFDPKNGVIKRFRSNPEKPGSLSASNCWFFFEDEKNKMWICTQNGLNLYDKKSNSFKVFYFPDNDLGAFYKDKSGYIWVGSNTKGLFLCNEDGTILRKYDNTNVLPNNRINAITQDNKGNIWISSNYGISRLNTEIQKVRNFDKNDGLQGDQFFQQSFLKTRAGELYFGGYSGFNTFYPDSLKENDFTPSVYITDFQIFNKSVDFGVPGSQFQTHISEAKEIVLRSDQSVFSFSFAAISYTHPEKNHYRYIMEGFEKEWNITDASRRYVTYTNLDPGKYTFKVLASNNDGAWNDKGVSLRIIILPPWWRTWWFRILFASAAILLFVFILLSRVSQFNKQKALLEKTVAMKTAELAELNASKDKFFSIIAHDLKNPFNTIIGFSDMMKESIRLNDSATFYEYTVMINTAAVQTLRLLENLLEWANSQRGKLSFTPLPFYLNELILDEFAMLDDMAMSKNISLESFLDDKLTIVGDKNMIRTVLRNLITNAVKYTHKNGQVQVKAVTCGVNVEIAVSDSGIGMTEDTMSKLFRLDGNLSTRGTENERGTGLGLFLCKEFIEKHNGKIWAESELGKGSTFKILLPLDGGKPDRTN
jgi:signal transduction histidine kinase/ligand-binding sensor domain-containing protein